MPRDYLFYRKKAGLDFDKFIERNPDKDGESLFSTFMARYDIYYKQREELVNKYSKRFYEEKDDEKLPRIEAEKMYAIAQLETVFVDVLRVLFGLSPDDKSAVFGTTIATRYLDFVKEHLSEEKQGFYIGADGLYRLAAFYDDDYVPLEVMKEYYLLGDKVYKDEDYQEPDIHIIMDGKEIFIPEQDPKDKVPAHLRVIEKLMELDELKSNVNKAIKEVEEIKDKLKIDLENDH